ncbi:TonB-dependent outer membrane receptor protein, RagA/SusC family [Psychroflexus gondwanensis ACAM 44]|uniref:TonB-dependent outer membrane receptor protein, RagA/SusC family n=1 Tax=Psychroflexus gondwanensis ACAM 44 TaxID=1189619 RepID=N1WYA3_9FLAO|nr:SusC/RagA family TonB-linked outer membrane protein [Psychroflexus gondwanensis]EMY82079.1 TonB-dependent outer membrane receptor protein, RagA/SusC family [Psychroflexus gondwanensis ACAM 44]
MKQNVNWIFLFLFALISHVGFAQSQEVTGTVVDNSGLPLPGVNVIEDGTSNGTQTDFDGNFSIEVGQGAVLVFSYLGLKEQKVTVGSQSSIKVTLKDDTGQLDEVVITALGIKREKKSLGYATQELDGDEVSDVATQNFTNALSGKVAGLQVKSSGTMGGSTNVVIRGNASLTGSNQALFIVDGTPVINQNSNTAGQRSGQGGYDYGNAAADINPDDIKSINVLRGAAASALYGERAANGVIIIETKKGSRNKGLGVSIRSSVMFSNADESTLPKYQQKYGAGYGPFYQSEDGYFNLSDINGDGVLDETTPFTEDASFGAAFDPDRMIYQWNSIYPGLDTYQQASPWVAAEKTPNDIWETGYTMINSVALDGGTDKSTYRVGFTNLDQEGSLPNSSIKRNNIKFSGSHVLSDKLKVASNVNFIKTDGKGRYGTGYDDLNIMQSFRQWNQANVDLYKQRDAYFETGRNITWNPNGPDNLTPIYTDNPYFTRYENFQTDTRNRYFGNINLNYEINDVFSVLGRFTFDTYSELQEERKNVGSVGVSRYSRFDNRVAEYNYDLILNFNKDLSEDLNLDGNIGFNLRRNEQTFIRASTNGGLNATSFYALSNSKDPLQPPLEYEADQMVDGLFARGSLGYKDTYYLEATIRRDRSSTLPKADNTYFYPSISTSVLLSNIVEKDWLSFAKFRANYAQVGSATDPYDVFNTYVISTPFNGQGIASLNSTLNNLELKSETSKSFEVGLEASFLDNRLNLDFSYYRTRTEDQITPVPVSNATGYTRKLLNAGEIENKGIEVLLSATPLELDAFSWNVSVNWSRNRNKVISLTDGIDNLELASLQGGISINAAPGEPYGAIRGSDYVYDDSGSRTVNSSGYYETTSSNNNIIGNIQPDWNAGITNTFTYKNFRFSFLIDIQEGGDIFSLDTWYGMATGVYDRTAGINDLGNEMRAPLTGGADSGGIILPGVNADGSQNQTRVPFDTYNNPYGYGRDANKGHVYDASYVKLRELNLTYNFGDKVLEKLPFNGASLSIIGRNLWIINKNLPYSDPEAGLSSGNIQGYQSGAYPAMQQYGVNLKFNF